MDAFTVRVKTCILLLTTAKISKVSPGTVTHGFSITGSLLGVACSCGGIYLLFIEGGFTIRTFRLIKLIDHQWLFAALLTLFFICLGAGAWSELAQQLGGRFQSSWRGELAMEIIAAFFWMGSIIIILEVEQLHLPSVGYTSIP